MTTEGNISLHQMRHHHCNCHLHIEWIPGFSPWSWHLCSHWALWLTEMSGKHWADTLLHNFVYYVFRRIKWKKICSVCHSSWIKVGPKEKEETYPDSKILDSVQLLTLQNTMTNRKNRMQKLILQLKNYIIRKHRWRWVGDRESRLIPAKPSTIVNGKQKILKSKTNIKNNWKAEWEKENLLCLVCSSFPVTKPGARTAETLMWITGATVLGPSSADFPWAAAWFWVKIGASGTQTRALT